MNALNRIINIGERVVVSPGMLKPEFDTLEWRTVEVTGGFGTQPYTEGTALYIKFRDGESIRWDANALDVDATNAIRARSEAQATNTKGAS